MTIRWEVRADNRRRLHPRWRYALMIGRERRKWTRFQWLHRCINDGTDDGWVVWRLVSPVAVPAIGHGWNGGDGGDDFWEKRVNGGEFHWWMKPRSDISPKRLSVEFLGEGQTVHSTQMLNFHRGGHPRNLTWYWKILHRNRPAWKYSHVVEF
jgi:hypothetical protein